VERKKIINEIIATTPRPFICSTYVEVIYIFFVNWHFIVLHLHDFLTHIVLLFHDKKVSGGISSLGRRRVKWLAGKTFLSSSLKCIFRAGGGGTGGGKKVTCLA
jgi:hypothetical protein